VEGASSRIVSVRELVSGITDGAKLIVPSDFNGFYAGVAMEATRELIRRGVRNLHLVALPTTGLQGDLLIGAGCVATMEAGSMFLGEQGVPPRFKEAFREKRIRMLEATCPAIHSALQAAEKGLPFIPVRGVIGSDVVKLRPDWKVVDNPFADGDPILLVPALRPDWALFHTAMADRHGNVYYGRRRELALMAHASGGALVTVEKLYDGNLMADPALSCATLPEVYVEAVAVAPKGAWPHGFPGLYEEDAEHIRHYLREARTAEGFRRYLDEFVLRETTAH
jgi:glutaconate CoA-transferase subunit A